MTTRPTLAGIELLASLSPEKLREFERRCRWRRYRAKEQIFDRESGGAEVYFIVQGKVQILNYSPTGKEIAFAEIDEGNFFGELAALDGKSRSATAVSSVDSVLASLSSPAFKELLLEHPEIAIVVLLRLAKIILIADTRIIDLITMSAINRVHNEILRMANPHGSDANKAIIHPVPTHSDIASRASTTRETVSRIISHLTRIRVLQKVGDGLEIRDVERLNDIVEQVDV